MDHYTISRLYEIVLHKHIPTRPLNKMKIDASIIVNLLSTILLETCKKMDSNKLGIVDY